MENKGIFPFNLLNKIRDPICERIARVVQRPCYMSIITPLIIPSKSPLITIKNNKTKLHFYNYKSYNIKRKQRGRFSFYLTSIIAIFGRRLRDRSWDPVMYDMPRDMACCSLLTSFSLLVCWSNWAKRPRKLR
jgi:hypothetical protein